MRPRRSRRDAGFTLIEVLAALAILGLVVGLVLPFRTAGTPRPRLESLALETAALFEADRHAALRQQRVVEATVDVGKRIVQSGVNGRAITMPADVGLSATLAETCPQATRSSVVVFFPDGMSCGGTIALSRPGTTYEIRVNWLTGAVEVVPHHDTVAGFAGEARALR